MYSGPPLLGLGVSGDSRLFDGNTSNADWKDLSETAEGGSAMLPESS